MTPEEHEEFWREDIEAGRIRGDYPAAIKTIVTAVRDIASTEAEVDRLRAECADRESERADLRDRVTKAEAEVAAYRLVQGRMQRPIRQLGRLLEAVESECATDEDVCHGYDLTDEGECALAHDLRAILAALEGGGDE